MTSPFEARPIVVAVAGPNGAGKSTFYEAFLRETGLRFVNADVLASHLQLDAYAAAEMADAIRRDLVRRGESFVFETVFSDPEGEKSDSRSYSSSTIPISPSPTVVWRPT